MNNLHPNLGIPELLEYTLPLRTRQVARVRLSDDCSLVDSPKFIVIFRINFHVHGRRGRERFLKRLNELDEPCSGLCGFREHECVRDAAGVHEVQQHQRFLRAITNEEVFLDIKGIRVKDAHLDLRTRNDK